MQQDLLAGAANRLPARFPPDFEAWRTVARRLLADGCEPGGIWWSPLDHGETGKHQSASPAIDARGSATRGTFLNVPRGFVDSARLVACHHADDRWALLYEILWRLTHGEPQLMSIAGDPAIARLQRYEKSVRRDHHKMKAFLRFRQTADQAGERFVAWFEPTHFIVDLAAEFFRRRFANMRWSILTPYRSAHWEGSGSLWFSGGATPDVAPDHDRWERAWQSYYRSTFNPARVKERAMLSEMPQKYWRHLPEAREISGLLAGADARAGSMVSAPAGSAALRCGERPASYERIVASAASSDDAWTRLGAELEACDACDHCSRATQVVPGAGARDARIMLVGEQPGDAEDLAGRPFAGPAGQLLDRALSEIGVDRRSLYVTNAVKHFRYRPAGKRRLHEKPREGDIHRCRPFLARELALVQPETVVCLGRTAASAVLGSDVSIASVRGRRLSMEQFDCYVTTHPAAVLRAGGGSTEGYRLLVRDLARAIAPSD